jgi:medium-chain acyl-[acyl-carrier-protein] hydrolase
VTGSLERTLRRLPRGDGVPLVCLPYAGGGSRSYDGWQGLLPPEVDPLTVVLPGRESRLGEPLPVDLVTEATRTATDLARVLDDRFVVFGHSMGALLAFEVVRALRTTTGREPECLVVSGTAAPDRLADVKRYGHLDDAELRRQIEAMGGTNPELLHDPEVWALMRPVLRADLLMCDRYLMAPAEPLHCPIVAYGSHSDDELTQESLDQWRTHTTNTFERRMFPGDHFYFQRIPEAFAMDLGKRLHRHVLDP